MVTKPIYVYVSMPHAALFVVQDLPFHHLLLLVVGFNAARGFVCGARDNIVLYSRQSRDSMPHAALFVVQVHESGGIGCDR